MHENRLVRGYNRLLEWDIVKGPRATRMAERLLNPVLGKSLVVYADKPARSSSSAQTAEREEMARAA